MKKITTIAICAAALASIASAEVAGTFSTGYHTDYIYRGMELGAGLEMMDFGLDFTGDCGCGLTWNAGIWYASTDSEATSDELDFYASVSKGLDFGPLSGDLSLGYLRYTYPQAANGSGKSGHDGEIFVGASTSAYGVSLGATYYIAEEGAPANNGNFGDGGWLDLTAGYGFDITDALSASIELGLGFGFGDAYGNDGLAVQTATLALDYALSDDITLSAYAQRVESESDYTYGGVAGVDEGIYGVSASYSF